MPSGRVNLRAVAPEAGVIDSADNPTPRFCPDVEIVLAAHRCFGEDAPKLLLGDFAYAVWDTVEQVLIAVRDRLAGRPFYYVDRDEYFAFASHDEALLSMPGVLFVPNYDHVASLFVPCLRDYDQFASWYANVAVLHPGSRLRFNRGVSVAELGERTVSSAEPFTFSSHAEAIEAFESVLRLAVSARLRTYGPPAMLLSGGIDSASVITAARSLLTPAQREPIRTYSALSDDESTCVESRAIRSLIESGSCAPTVVHTPSFDGGLSSDELAKLVWGQADPISNSLILHMPLFARARADGCTSVVNGTGGDLVTAVAGYYPGRLIRSGRWHDAWRESKAIAANNTYLHHQRPSEIFLRSMLASMPESAKERVRQAMAGLPAGTNPDVRLARQIFSPSFLAQTNLLPRLRVSEQTEPRITLFDAGVRQHTVMDWLAHGQIGYDRLAGRFGLASRDVWSDLRLATFYLRLPITLRTSGGWTKSLVREYLRARGLPAIADRKDKQHVGWKFSNRLVNEQAGLPPPRVSLAQQTFSAEFLSRLVVALDSGDSRAQFDNFSPDQVFFLRATLSWVNRLSMVS